ncbi:uncharacterized protein M6G45_015710 [Spheniscus humboldti]
MGQANCCCGSRWALPGGRGHAGMAGCRSSGLPHSRRSLLCREALSDAEAVLSTDVRLTRGRKRSERRLLLLEEELVIAKLQHGGTTPRPQLCLALDQLWVVSGGKEAAGEEEEQEEEGSNEDRTSIILIWPTDSCVARGNEPKPPLVAPCSLRYCIALTISAPPRETRKRRKPSTQKLPSMAK